MSNLSYKNSGLNTNTVVQNNSEKRFFIKINKGYERGAVFQISSSEVLIGRDPSNHIQLKNDPKVSRQHVRLTFEGESYFIQDITKNNFITVNGIKTKQVELKKNEVIQIGDHVLQFIENSPKASPKMTNNNPKNQTNTIRYFLLAVIVIGFGYYFTTPPARTKSSSIKIEAFDNNEKSERRIGSIEDSIKDLDKKYKDSIFSTENGRNAQSIFIQGQRDFNRGQFFYARDAFRAVLSIEPSHPEARRLLRLSLQFSEDLLERQFKEGLANKESGRFEICKSSMKNIMNLLNDPTSSRYREAKKVLIECDLKKRGNF